MVFSSIVFLFYFLPLTVLLVFLLRLFIDRDSFVPQNLVLLVMSLLFYSWGEPVYVFLMIGSILFNFTLGKTIGNSTNIKKRKAYFTLALILNISTLALFKYAGMFLTIVNAAIPYHDSLIHVPEIRLPIGISFFTFQSMSYLFDVYRNEVPVQKKLINLALYISFFPQLIAGPIVRYHDINEQLEKRIIDLKGVYYGLIRFITGLAKKVLIANVVAKAADEIFTLGANELTAPLAWLGIICYTLQIYFDFSGYSDMAIGLGRIFGFKFLENFNYPYISKGIQEFWKRWHISLSSWFRDYLYIPLGGNRKGEFRTYVNLVIVFFLCGLWHGASWTFVVWGLYHGFFLTIEKLYLGKQLKKAPVVLTYFYTILVVMVGWVLFRSENLLDSFMYLKAMLGFGAGENIIIWRYLENNKLIFILVIGAIASTPIFKKLIERLRIENIPVLYIKTNYIKIPQYILIYLLVIALTGFITFPHKKLLNTTTESSIYIKSNSPLYQVFYSFPGESFTENNSIKFKESKGAIPEISKLESIRIDAMMIGVVWEIESISFINHNSSLELRGEKLLKSIYWVSSDLEHPELNNSNNVEMSVVGSDPYFILKFDYPLSEFDIMNNAKEIKQDKYTKQWRMSILVIVLLLIIPLVIAIKKQMSIMNHSKLEIPVLRYAANCIYIATIIFIVLYIIGNLAVNTYNPFIYFRF